MLQGAWGNDSFCPLLKHFQAYFRAGLVARRFRVLGATVLGAAAFARFLALAVFSVFFRFFLYLLLFLFIAFPCLFGLFLPRSTSHQLMPNQWTKSSHAWQVCAA